VIGRLFPMATLCTLAVLAASASAPAAPEAPTPAGAGGRRELVVFAAASLREVFEALAAGFERAHPGTRVRLNLAGSQELRTQIEQGARADLFASADPKQMARLQTQGLVEKGFTFARNEAVIVVPRDNPAGIHQVTDLPKTRRLVVGAPEVPIGGYTVRIFEGVARKHGPDLRARIEAAIVSRELNVRQVLAKVSLGEADAGVVYRSDAQAARDRVQVVAIPPDLNVVAEYPIAVLAASREPQLARAWLELVRTPEAQRRLVAAGFLPALPLAASPAPSPPGRPR
jgi:molybdate transport system substrate-binding protein